MDLYNAESFQRVLLIHAPAFDTRLPWAAWHQPVGLLQIGALLRSKGCDVKLIDCLQTSGTNRLPKRRIRKITIEGTTIDLWRIGMSPEDVAKRVVAWQEDGWTADAILITSGMTFWWEAARELIRFLKSRFAMPIYLGGAYPTYYYQHALEHSGADKVFCGNLPDALGFHSDLTLYAERLAGFAAVHIANLDRKSLLNELRAKHKIGIRTFALFDEYLGIEHQELLEENLLAISRLKLEGLRFIAPGNISPRAVSKNIAKALKNTNFKNIFFHDDVFHSLSEVGYRSEIAHYQSAIRALRDAGFELRTNEIGAAVLTGLPRENLSALTQRIVQLASITGSVHLVPYQYTPGTFASKSYEMWLAQRDGAYDPTTLNGRLFPLARLAGKSFNDYVELTRLVALLNSKFHNHTFDFLGDSLTARMVRKGVSEELWDPFKGRRNPAEPVELQVVQNDTQR